MIKAVVTDFSRVLLFPLDDSYVGGLNALNNKLLAKDPNYNFWNYFRLNKELLDYYRELNGRTPVYTFTTETIQDHPAVKQEIDGAFSGVLSALKFSVEKSDPNAYRAVADYLKIPIEEILFIDDTANNIVQAQTAGMQTIQFESNPQAIDAVNSTLQS